MKIDHAFAWTLGFIFGFLAAVAINATSGCL